MAPRITHRRAPIACLPETLGCVWPGDGVIGSFITWPAGGRTTLGGTGHFIFNGIAATAAVFGRDCGDIVNIVNDEHKRSNAPVPH